LDIIKDAVKERGFLGIKVYPPMGFRPIGNAELDNLRDNAGKEIDGFPGVMEQLWDLLTTPPPYLAREPKNRQGEKGYTLGNAGKAIIHAQDSTIVENYKTWMGAYPYKEFKKIFSGLGVKLDTALQELYAWCIEEDVPIMAHCSNSQGSHINRSKGPIDPNDPHYVAENFGLRAAPEYWARVLEKYPRLRLNIGHFGGIWNLARTDLNGSSSDQQRANASKDWPREIIEILENEQYPNVYGDLADWSEAALSYDVATLKTTMECTLDQKTDRAFDYLKQHSNNQERLTKKLLYGTDWIMLGRDAGVDGYLRGLATRFECHFGWDATVRFFHSNAIDFLHLRGPNSQPLQRLKTFYEGHPKALALLRELTEATG
jgi:hypothetical protein